MIVPNIKCALNSPYSSCLAVTLPLLTLLFTSPTGYVVPPSLTVCVIPPSLAVTVAVALCGEEATALAALGSEAEGKWERKG